MPTDYELKDEVMNILREKGDRIMRADLDQVEVLLAHMSPDTRYEITPWIFEGLSLHVNGPGYEGDLPPVEDITDPFDEAIKFVRRRGLRLRKKHLVALDKILTRVGPELHPHVKNEIALSVGDPRYEGDIPADEFEFDAAAAG